MDTLPIGYRFGDKSKAQVRVRPNSKYSHIKATIDTGNKPNNTVMKTEKDQRLVRLKGENFGRIAPKTLANYIKSKIVAVTLRIFLL